MTVICPVALFPTGCEISVGEAARARARASGKPAVSRKGAGS